MILDDFLEKERITSLGRLCLLLFVCNRLRFLPYPFSVSDITTEKGGQISGLSGRSVSDILSLRNISVNPDVLGEGGRTNRGSVADAEKFISWLNQWFDEDGFDASACPCLRINWHQRLSKPLEIKAVF